MSGICYHCDLPLPVGEIFETPVLGLPRSFCCPGCLAIAETIVANNMESFYQFRTQKNLTPEELIPQELLEIEALDNPAVLENIIKLDNNLLTIELGIEGITCAACAWLIKNQVVKLDSVSHVEVNATTHRAIVKFAKDSALSLIIKTIRELGYRAYPFSEDQQEIQLKLEDKAYSRRLIVAGLAMMQVMMFATGLYLGEFQDISAEHAYFLHIVSGLLATPVVFYSALPFFTSAWRSLKHLHFGMNLPVSIAILSAYLASLYSLLTKGEVYYFDSVVMFTFFLLVGRFLEHKMRLKAILKQQNFKRLIPLSVSVMSEDSSSHIVPINKVQPNDIIIVHAGAVVPLDGELIDSEAEINESVITGEFLPVKKHAGDKLFSGSTNHGASFKLRAEYCLQDCRIQQLVKLQSDTEHLTSTRVSLADKIAGWYVIGLLTIATATGISWYFIEPTMVFPVVLSLLVVSCPCALSLATPAAVAAATAQLTDLGLMIRSNQTLSKLADVESVFFDKTGTLTLGEIQLVETILHTDLSHDESLQIAKSLESISNHPIALAFKHLGVQSLPISSGHEEIAGGVEAKVAGKLFRIGSDKFVRNKLPTEQQTQIKPVKNHITIYLCNDQQLVATFVLDDEINPTAKQAVNSLQSQNLGVRLISGDSTFASQQVANQLNIDQFYSNVSPEEKLSKIKHHAKVCLMVGDGVNDIGALAQAEVGITTGNAAHLSKATSNAVLVSHDLNVIPKAIAIAKKLTQIIHQNLTWAVIYNITAIPFAIAGLVPAWLAAVGMTASSLIVVLNALRLRR